MLLKFRTVSFLAGKVRDSRTLLPFRFFDLYITFAVGTGVLFDLWDWKIVL